MREEGASSADLPSYLNGLLEAEVRGVGAVAEGIQDQHVIILGRFGLHRDPRITEDDLAPSCRISEEREAIFGQLDHGRIDFVEAIDVLGLSVGSKLQADQFLVMDTLGILLLGMVAFGIGTASGVLMGKLMNRLSSHPVNPLIGAAGVSAVPMAARVANRVGLEANPHNILLMHAMGPNVAGVIGSAVAAGIMIMFTT